MQRKKENGNNNARERILAAAYELFSRDGFQRVTIEDIVARAGCARASLYNIFGSKEGLISAFLDHRGEVRSGTAIEESVKERTDDPRGRLLAIFDVLDDWFTDDDFGRGSLIGMLLDAQPDSYIHSAITEQFSKVRATIHKLAVEALLESPDEFSEIWHMLMKGAIVAENEGRPQPALVAQRGAAALLGNWPTLPTAR